MLETDKIVLRPLRDADLSFLEKVENDKENWQFGSEQKQYSKQELVDYIANARRDIKIAKQYRFVIDLNSTPIGFIDLFNYANDSAGMGVIITEKYRKNGFAKEALNLLTDYAFIILDINQLHATIKKDNLASIKLFTSCGFERRKELKDLQYFVKLAEN